jgi:hypothetical protein
MSFLLNSETGSSTKNLNERRFQKSFLDDNYMASLPVSWDSL